METQQAQVETQIDVGAVDSLSPYDHKRLDKDIKYNAPFSYRYFRIIGWFCLAATFVSLVLGAVVNLRLLLGSAAPESLGTYNRIANVISYFSALPLPLFLIANFTVILQNRKNYKNLIYFYSILVAGVYLAFIFVYYHYVVLAIMRTDNVSFLEARARSIESFAALGLQNGLVVNVFVDLLSCVFIMFFIEYEPKKYFQGRKIILFRLMVLIPIFYQIASATILGLLGLNSMYGFLYNFSVPPEILPLLGKKPIGMIAAFVVICLYVKFDKKRYLKKGGTLEGYEEYTKTNRHSFRFSLMMALTFLIVAVVDFIVVLVPTLIKIQGIANPDDALLYATIYIDELMNFTLGKSVCLLLVIPLCLLYSYTKQHKNPKLDKFIPIGGIALIAFAIIETLFFAIFF